MAELTSGQRFVGWCNAHRCHLYGNPIFYQETIHTFDWMIDLSEMNCVAEGSDGDSCNQSWTVHMIERRDLDAEHETTDAGGPS